MTEKPKPKTEPGGYTSPHGPIPLDYFGNDIPGNPVDTSPGSQYDKLKQELFPPPAEDKDKKK